MRASLFIESLPHTPSSAWAARPLASGAPSALIGRRGRSSAGVGCPSFGGQRTGSDIASRLLAQLVTSSNPHRPANGGEIYSVVFSSQTARSAALATVGRSVASLCLGTGRRAWPTPKSPNPGHGLTGKQPMHEISIRQPPTARQPGFSPAPLAASRSGRLLVQCGSPNHSVEGTSCGKPQAAPYLER